MRVHDWHLRLDAVVEAARKREFKYGDFDCAMFAADCAQAVTGIDPAASVRGYESKTAAYRIIASYGSMEAMITSLLAQEPIHPSAARRGDFMLGTVDLGPGENGEIIGVCVGSRVAYPSITRGLRLLPRSTARLAWRVE